MLRKVAHIYFAVLHCFGPRELVPICIDDLAIGPLKKAYSRFRRRGRPDKQGRVNAKGFAKALRVKDTPFLRKLLVCWSRNRTGTIDFREFVVGLSEFCPAQSEKEKSHDTELRFAFRLTDQNDDGYLGRSDLEHLSEYLNTQGESVPASAMPLDNLFAEMAQSQLNTLDFAAYHIMVSKFPHMKQPINPLWRALQPFAAAACDLVRTLRLQGHVTFLEAAPMGRLAEPKRNTAMLMQETARSLKPMPRSRSPGPTRRDLVVGHADSAPLHLQRSFHPESVQAMPLLRNAFARGGEDMTIPLLGTAANVPMRRDVPVSSKWREMPSGRSRENSPQQRWPSSVGQRPAVIPTDDSYMVESVIAALGAGPAPRHASRAVPINYYSHLDGVAQLRRSPAASCALTFTDRQGP